MAYEYINVRMSRSNANINWGFTLRQGAGNDLIVASVERDSMADKAGIVINDTVQELFGRTGTDMNEARNRIQNSNEVTMVLKRFMSNPPSLPWSLDERDNKVVVNHLDSRGRLLGQSDQKTNGYVNSFVSSSGGGGAPLSQSSYNTSNFSRNVNESSTTGPISYGLQPFRDTTNALTVQPGANTVSSESHSKWDTTEGNVKKHFESSRSYQKTESSSVSPAGGGYGATNWGTTGSNLGQTGAGGFGQSTTGGSAWGGFTSSTGGGPNWGGSGTGGQFTSGFTSGGGGGAPFSSGQSQTNNYQSNNFNSTSGGGAGYGSGSGGQFSSGQKTAQYDRQPQFDEKRAASMQPTYVETTHGGGRGGRDAYGRGGQQDRAHSSTPHSGPRQYYQYSPRTYRELSPQATVRHLQYNTPLGMYSPEAVAEQYKMQTGQNMHLDPDHPGTRPVWMDSATRRAIAEEEQGRRAYSPDKQSSSFKRISAACGTPVQ